MPITVQMIITPPDPRSFREACAWLASQPRPDGLSDARVLADENGSGQACLQQDWDSHDHFHAFTERIGEEFNRRAGTVGLDWETRVWTSTDIPTL